MYFEILGELKMRTFSEERVISASPERLFALYADVAHWSTWDDSVASSSIFGPFTAGTSGTMQPKSGMKAKIVLVSVMKDKSFTVQSALPLCMMTFEHELLPLGNATRVVHRVTFDGPFSFLFGFIIGRQIQKDLPKTLLGLKHAAEN